VSEPRHKVVSQPYRPLEAVPIERVCGDARYGATVLDRGPFCQYRTESFAGCLM